MSLDTTFDTGIDTHADDALRAELELYRAAFRAISDVAKRAAAGDLEARVPMLDGGDQFVEVQIKIPKDLPASYKEAAEKTAETHFNPREGLF